MSGAARRGGSRSAFGKTIARSIWGSLGRFLAIVGIVALGCGFYAGLQMCGPDMRADADAFYDGTNLYDIRLVSSLGFTTADARRVEATEGVEDVMPAISFDVMAKMGSEQLAVRMSSLDVQAAKKGEELDANVILSDDGTYLNRVFLREGRWPRAADECLVSADKEVAGIGVGDTIEVLYGTSDIEDMLHESVFHVVGTASSSNYPYTGSFGSTTLGSGMIGEYVYVVPEAFVDDAPYTEIYLRVAGAESEESGSDAYQENLDVVRARLEAREDELAEARLSDIRADAQKELDEKRAEYEDERKKALDELSDAKKKLEDAHDELVKGSQEYEDGREEYDRGVDELASKRAEAQAQLDDARAQMESGAQTLEENRAKLKDARAQYESGVESVLSQTGAKDLTAARSTLEGQRAQIKEARSTWNAGCDQMLSALSAQGVAASSLDEAATSLTQMIAGAEAAGAPEQQLAQLKEALSSVQQLQQSEESVTQAEAMLPQLEEALAGIAQLESAGRQVADGERQLKDAEAQLLSGRRELETKGADATRQFEEGQAKLDDAHAKLVKAADDLARGNKEYEDGLAEYEDGRKEAIEKLEDAQKKLDEAQAEIDDLEPPDLYVLDRSQNEGALTYDADSRRMDSIADVFPLMFFLVAALVALTTMTRMVEDDRIEIGTYKALGYSTARIASKYLAYAGIASAIGAVLGILALSQLLPFIVTSAYSIIYTVPLHPFPQVIDLGISLVSGGLGVGVTLLATWAAVVATLRETPATLMLPRAPAAGKRILLERVGPIWRRLTFSWKVTCRNLFRYKRRLMMTVIGISGCAALLLVGFGLHDSIWDIIDKQYGPIIHYDTTVGLDSDAKDKDVIAVKEYLEGTGDVTDIIRVQHYNMQASTRDKDETLRVQVVVPQDPEQIARARTFRNRETAEDIRFTKDSVIVTEKIALKYDLAVGDTLLLFDQDSIGNAKGEGHPITITGVAENYVGNLVYLGEDAWGKVDAEKPVYSTLYASTTDDKDVRNQIADELHGREDVSTVVYSDETVNLYRNMLSVVDMVVVLLIVSAGLLAFIVLYNLTNINIAERVREIASLKVLGFTQREVYAYIYREISLQSIMGDILGMGLGTWLATFVITTAEVDYVMFGRSIHPMSYVYSFAITLVFTALILLLMRHKLDRVDMVESLKSVD